MGWEALRDQFRPVGIAYSLKRPGPCHLTKKCFRDTLFIGPFLFCPGLLYHVNTVTTTSADRDAFANAKAFAPT